MSEKEVMEMINAINNMSDKEFDKILKDTEKEIFSKDFCKELNEIRKED